MTKINIVLVMKVFHPFFVFAFTVPQLSKMKYEPKKTRQVAEIFSPFFTRIITFRASCKLQ